MGRWMGRKETVATRKSSLGPSCRAMATAMVKAMAEERVMEAVTVAMLPRGMVAAATPELKWTASLVVL